MANTKSTKRALLASGLALLLCVSMLVGTTFAWFTDSVTSSGNKIVSGNLDIELYMWNGTTEADKVEITDDSAPIFGGENSLKAQNDAADTLWEPGKTQVVYLSLKNAGNLDLKYRVAIDVKNPTDGKNLYKVMQYAITRDAKYGDVEAWSNGIDVVPGANATEANNVALKKGEEHFFALSVHMDEEAGNEYMGGMVEFDIKVLAAQIASEQDSFGNTYDALATYEEGEYLISGETLTATASAGETVTLANDNDSFKVNAIAGDDGAVTATINPTNSTEAVMDIAGATGKSLVSYDINVDGQKDGSEVSIDLFVGKNLRGVTAYHEGVEMDAADYSYNATTGYVTIKTTTFSPYEITYLHADDVPLAKVTKLDLGEVNATLGMGGAVNTYNLDIGYLFEMMQTAEEAANSPYAKYHADFVVSADKDVEAEAIALLGYYKAYCDDHNKGNWVAMVGDEVKAGSEIRLVEALLNGGSINYEEIGEFVEAFRCGASKLKDSVKGTTLTVELRLYEVKDPSETENNTWNEETGEYFSICTYNYTF